MSDLDDLAQQVRERGLVLAYSPGDYVKIGMNARYAPAWLKQAIRSHRRGLHRLMLEGDIRLCPNPDLHRQFYRYIGAGRFQCQACTRLDAYQLGLWSATA